MASGGSGLLSHESRRGSAEVIQKPSRQSALSELNEAENFVFRALLCIDELRALEPNGVYLRDSHRRLGRALSELSFAEFSPQIQDDI